MEVDGSWSLPPDRSRRRQPTQITLRHRIRDSHNLYYGTYTHPGLGDAGPGRANRAVERAEDGCHGRSVTCSALPHRRVPTLLSRHREVGPARVHAFEGRGHVAAPVSSAGAAPPGLRRPAQHRRCRALPVPDTPAPTPSRSQQGCSVDRRRFHRAVTGSLAMNGEGRAVRTHAVASTPVARPTVRSAVPMPRRTGRAASPVPGIDPRPALPALTSASDRSNI